MGEYKIFSFPSCVFGWRGGKWESGKLFCFVEKKSGNIENVVYIN